jgi:hypothetical protein
LQIANCKLPTANCQLQIAFYQLNAPNLQKISCFIKHEVLKG